MAGDLLIMQSIGNGDDWFAPWLEMSRPIHEEYAEACGADYELFRGVKDPHVHPAWNRIPMFLAAFARGYRKVLWLDADTLVVDQAVDIFTETDDTTPLHMVRAQDAHVEIPWGEPGWDLYNDGVLIANNCDQAAAAFRYVWSQRHEVPLAHHIPALWELNALTDFVFAHRDCVAELPFRFNWMPFEYACPESEAVIMAYHGMPHDQRWELVTAKYAEVYGTPACA